MAGYQSSTGSRCNSSSPSSSSPSSCERKAWILMKFFVIYLVIFLLSVFLLWLILGPIDDDWSKTNATSIIPSPPLTSTYGTRFDIDDARTGATDATTLIPIDTISPTTATTSRNPTMTSTKFEATVLPFLLSAVTPAYRTALGEMPPAPVTFKYGTDSSVPITYGAATRTADGTPMGKTPSDGAIGMVIIVLTLFLILLVVSVVAIGQTWVKMWNRKRCKRLVYKDDGVQQGQLTVWDTKSTFQLPTCTTKAELLVSSELRPTATNVPLDPPVPIDELPGFITGSTPSTSDSLDSYDTNMATGQVVKKLIGPSGGVLFLESRGITMFIPAGALDCAKTITLKALTEPPDVCDREDEMIVSLGYECSPSGLHFGKPVMISFPHAASFHDPERAETILYSGHGKYRKDDTDVERIPLSAREGVPRCIVRENLMELYVEHFSWGWLTALVNRRNVRGKRIGCVPFMPRELPSDHVPILRLHLFMITKSDPNPVERISTVEGGLGNTLRALEQIVDAAVGKDELVISCQSKKGESEAQVKMLSHKCLKRLVQKTIYFSINLTSTPFANKLLSLSLQQAISMDFLFWTNYKDTCEVVIPVETEILCATGSDSSSDDGDISPRLYDIADAIETDAQMERLGRSLGFKEAEIRRYAETNRMEGRVTARGTRDMLHDWRQTVHRELQRPALRDALRRARLLDILDKHLPTNEV